MCDGRFACGRVLQLRGEENPTPSRAFFGGLHTWVGTDLPSVDAEMGEKFIQIGLMHIRSIIESGGSILGERPLERDGIQMPMFLPACGGEGTMLLSGATHLRPALRREWGTMPILGLWGYDFIVLLANSTLARVAT